VVSYLGYVEKEVAVGDETSVVITMEEDKKNVDEVVVVGYGTVKKSDLTKRGIFQKCSGYCHR
jgi:hypothetical protein